MARSLHTAAHRELVSAVVALRKASGLTQREMAARVGREQNFIGRIETGQRRIDLVEWVMICRACDLDPGMEMTRVLANVIPLIARAARTGKVSSATAPRTSRGSKAGN